MYRTSISLFVWLHSKVVGMACMYLDIAFDSSVAVIANIFSWDRCKDYILHSFFLNSVSKLIGKIITNKAKKFKRKNIKSYFFLLGVCPQGRASETGLEPCLPCPVGHFQPFLGQTFCFQCPTQVTFYIGAFMQSFYWALMMGAPTLRCSNNSRLPITKYNLTYPDKWNHPCNF